MSKQIFLIQRLCLDWMENEISAAKYYKQIGYVDTLEEATSLIKEAGTVTGNGWPLDKGETVDRLRAIPLGKIENYQS